MVKELLSILKPKRWPKRPPLTGIPLPSFFPFWPPVPIAPAPAPAAQGGARVGARDDEEVRRAARLARRSGDGGGRMRLADWKTICLEQRVATCCLEWSFRI